MNSEAERGDTREETLHEGHRQRMLERLGQSENGLQDHEILEILLFYVIPRQNTNPVAHALIRAFGSLSGVFGASTEELLLVKGVGKKTAQYLRALALVFSRVKLQEDKTITVTSPMQLSNYLQEKYRGRATETLEILCADKQNHIFFRKEFNVGKTNEVLLNPREVSALILAQKTHLVVAAHNHPNASSAPSAEDDRFTKQLYMLCTFNNVKFGDHIIIGNDGVYSYRAVGRLNEIMKECAQIKFD